MQQAISWPNTDLDLCCHVASSGHDEFLDNDNGNAIYFPEK